MACVAAARRIVQYKMILKLGLFPIQDDPEILSLPRCWVDADSHGKYSGAYTGGNHRISLRQRADRVHWTEPHREVRLDRDHVKRPAVLLVEQEAAGSRARAAKQGCGAECPPDHPTHPKLPAKWKDSGANRIAAMVSSQVQHGGFGVAH